MTEEQEKFMEENVFPIISLAGESKSLAYEALRLAKENKFDEAEEKMKEADSLLLKSHEFQTNLISREADGEKIEITMLFVHAQDHLMTAMSEKNLIKEMIDILKQK
ncbi:PTS lactose/cellobiose transporter subunit IIA [Brachyspira pilosicoli]|uniref:PTS system, IIa component n=3 Tax=Brachyspira pilosicoli TaxID=52584 RepID=D8IEP5_BRAP9|nr:PTS lactose/cellobiose transporter subunit IIA [Brachyspira pilosicoli]ADK31618.1 PTS system, IIa component [Brachyspira pilosicoli 95/1000]MBW5378673.1 PTS lactose/cellobiose transporter subunit IIA [Brachyspira pilosicoli]MBW5391647.1 PTS lactose/cellobiose transporter subunit IIA [Brachyspira pilosicoli]MBW5399693.1 PTS lactose/cellobiose transporter subunit IIA [Brachyspira pilosicoli]WIH80439.1 PTS lactose/cellobiose transporter subunit IIA [Brachyspira pilosicoli]